MRSGPCTSGMHSSCTSTLMSHVHLQIGSGSAQSHFQATAFRPWIVMLRQAGGQARFRPDSGQAGTPFKRLLLAEAVPLRDTTDAQIVQSINRERNRAMARTKTKSALLRRRRMGPEPGEDFPRPQDRPLPDRVARERSTAEPVAQTPRLGARAKRQADQFAAGFIGAPVGKAEAKPEPLDAGEAL